MYIRRIRYFLYLEVAKVSCKSFKGSILGDVERTGRVEVFARSSHYRWLWLLSLDNAVVLLLFIHCLLLHHLFVGRCLVLVLLCSI